MYTLYNHDYILITHWMTSVIVWIAVFFNYRCCHSSLSHVCLLFSIHEHAQQLHITSHNSINIYLPEGLQILILNQQWLGNEIKMANDTNLCLERILEFVHIFVQKSLTQKFSEFFSAKRRIFILNYFVLFIWSEQYCDVAKILCKSVTIHHTQTNEAFAWGYLLQKQKWESILSRKPYRFSLNFLWVCSCIQTC